MIGCLQQHPMSTVIEAFKEYKAMQTFRANSETELQTNILTTCTLSPLPGVQTRLGGHPCIQTYNPN